MNKFAAAVICAFSIAQGPVLAQQKPSEPAKQEVKKPTAAKADTDKDAAKKDSKKKAKKGGC